MRQRKELHGTINGQLASISSGFLIFYERIQNLVKLHRNPRNRSQVNHSADSSEEWLNRKGKGNQPFFSLWPELSENSGKPWKRRKSQTSLLLTLPFEIREEIFKLAIGVELLHLVDMKSRVGYIRCSGKHDEEELFWKQKTCNRNCASPLWRLVSYRSTPTFEGSSGFPALLLTCRQNYSQGVGILYSSNIFEAEYPETVVSLAECIRPSLLGSIRFLQVSGRARVMKFSSGFDQSGIDRNWDEMWEIICNKMKSLRSLQVKMRIQFIVQYNQPDGWNDRAYTLLREWLEIPIKNLRGMKHFSLRIDAPSTNDRVLSFQDKLEMLVCSLTPKGTPDKFPELYTRISLTEQ